MDLLNKTDEEIIEEGMWVGKVLSEKFKDSRVITDERIGKLSLIDESISVYESKLPLISNDTDNIVKYLSNDENTNKKKYSFLPCSCLFTAISSKKSYYKNGYLSSRRN